MFETTNKQKNQKEYLYCNIILRSFISEKYVKIHFEINIIILAVFNKSTFSNKKFDLLNILNIKN